MEEMKCSHCGEPLKNGEPHCSQCKETMKCEGATCMSTCGNIVPVPEVKCDVCLGMTA